MTTPGRASLCAALLACAILPASLAAQGARERLETLAKDNGILYVKPLTTGLGVAMNQGIFHTAAVHKLLGFHIGVSVGAMLVQDEDNTFAPVLPGSVTYRGVTFSNPYGDPNAAAPTPTVTGAGSGRVFEPQGGYRTAISAAGGRPRDFALEFPDGLDIPAVPFAVIQGSLGLILGTEVSVRFIPQIETTEEVGSISATGFGIKHSLSQYIPLFPLDVAAFGALQNLEVGDYLDASATAYGLIASKNLGPLTLYGAGSREAAEVDVGYTVQNPENNPGLPAHGTRIGFTDKLDPQTRLTFGATLNLLVLKISGDYSLADRNAVSLKVLLSFR